MEKRRNSERGQALVLVVLCLAVVLGFLGFAIDAGQLYRAKQILQTAADAAAIAGAQQILYSDWNAAAKAAATQNGITNNVNGAIVTVNHPPTAGAHTALNDPTGANNYVEVVISQPQPTGFFYFINKNAMTVSARSVATNGPSHNCLYTLGTTGTDISINGFLVANLSMPGCGIVVDSSDNSAISLGGFAIDTISAGSVGIVGKYRAGWGSSITPTPVVGINPVGDPLAYLTDLSIPGGCLKDPKITSGSDITLDPRNCWNGLTLTGGKVTFSPGGPYIINGDLTISGVFQSVTGNGVTFYVTGAINFNGAQHLNLSAPTSGTYNGVLFMAPLANKKPMTFTGISYSTLSGIFHLPGSAIQWEGISSTTFNNSIIVNSLSFTGVGQINDYAMVNPATPLTGTRVVE